MIDLVATLEPVVRAVTRLRATLKRGANRQVRSADERALVKATAHAWFQTHKSHLATLQADPSFRLIDAAFAELLQLSDQNTTRAKYLALLKTLKANLLKFRSSGVLIAVPNHRERPLFGVLISNPKM